MLYIFIPILLLICFFDIKNFIIPDWLSFPLIIMGIGFNIINKNSIQLILLNMLICPLLLLIIYYINLLIFKREGLGGGDIKLAAGIGLILSWKYGLVTLFLSAFIALLVSFILIIMRKKDLNSKIAFGFYMSLCTILMIITKKLVLNNF